MHKLKHYLSRHRGVEGWLDSYSARFIAEISAIQSEARLSGGVGEIGVHRGRLFILLKLLAGTSERAVAIDVFGDQHLNTDGSGEGDEDKFLRNLDRWASRDKLDIIQKSSLYVTSDEILSRTGQCRLFSIDGGHTAECTLNDLRLGDQVLSERGVLILDDYFNPSWPDVSTGASQFFADPNSSLRPFAITPNKLYLARPSCHSFYLSALRRTQRDYFEKLSQMFGETVAVFGIDPETHRLALRLKRWVKKGRFGPAIVKARHGVRKALGA